MKKLNCIFNKKAPIIFRNLSFLVLIIFILFIHECVAGENYEKNEEGRWSDTQNIVEELKISPSYDGFRTCTESVFINVTFAEGKVSDSARITLIIYPPKGFNNPVDPIIPWILNRKNYVETSKDDERKKFVSFEVNLADTPYIGFPKENKLIVEDESLKLKDEITFSGPIVDYYYADDGKKCNNSTNILESFSIYIRSRQRVEYDLEINDKPINYRNISYYEDGRLEKLTWDFKNCSCDNKVRAKRLCK